MKPVHFVDTTLRDGNASLWAMGMRTDMILPVAAQIDRAGFQAVEITTASFFKKMVREHRNDPWERVRRVAELAPRTPLRAIIGRATSTFEFTPASISNLYLERLFAHGVREVRISDSSNTVSVWERRVGDSRRVGLKTILNLVYSVSPVHTDVYYERLTQEAVKLGVDRLCLKDPGGLLTPERTRVLAPIVVRNARGIPVEFHTHCNTGLGPLCALEAVKAGIDIVNTAIPPLANGSSNPSVFNVAANVAALGYTPTVDLEALRQVSEHFTQIARREGLPMGTPLEYKETHFIQQVPGGMISNLRHQLTQMKMLDRLPEVLEEIVRVRRDFGYPIMVTPYSQFVGVQATLNVIAGARYKQLSDQMIHYALGFWGEAEAAAMDPDLRERILASPRARELAGWQPQELSLAQVREHFGGPGVSDDELLVRYLAGNDSVEAMRAAPPPRVQSLDGGLPLAALIDEVTRKSRISQIRIEKRGFVFHMGKAGQDGA